MTGHGIPGSTAGMKMGAQQYAGMAERAGEVGAYVAAIMYYRTAAEAIADKGELMTVLEGMIGCAERLKKLEDRLAVYDWGIKVISDRLQRQGDRPEGIEKLAERLVKLIRVEV